MRAYLLSNLLHDTLPMIVHYEDRGAMQYSVEERFPLLDYRLLEWTLRLPTHFLVNGGITKRVLRAAVSDLLPEKVRNRTSKLGFVTPTAGWTKPCCRSLTSARRCLPPTRGSFDRTRAGYFSSGTYQHRAQFSWRMMNYPYWRARFRVSD